MTKTVEVPWKGCPDCRATTPKEAYEKPDFERLRRLQKKVQVRQYAQEDRKGRLICVRTEEPCPKGGHCPHCEIAVSVPREIERVTRAEIHLDLGKIKSPEEEINKLVTFIYAQSVENPKYFADVLGKLGVLMLYDSNSTSFDFETQNKSCKVKFYAERKPKRKKPGVTK